jgi:hypothetical protein
MVIFHPFGNLAFGTITCLGGITKMDGNPLPIYVGGILSLPNWKLKMISYDYKTNGLSLGNDINGKDGTDDGPHNEDVVGTVDEEIDPRAYYIGAVMETAMYILHDDGIGYDMVDEPSLPNIVIG